MQLYLSRKKCYSENNTDTKAERGAKSIRRKKGGNKMEFVFEHATMIAVIAVVVIILAILASGYVKAPPDTAFIISGFKKGQRILIGKAGIKLPFFERLDKLSLKLVAIDVKTSDAVPTADYINIQVDAAVNIKVGDEPQKLQKASQNFLNRDSEYIAKVAREVLEGNMREIVGKMRLEEMVSDRQKFAELVKENAEPDLAAMGLDIISFNVQNFVDSNQVIENLGIDNIVKIKKSAAIARANSEKEIKIAQARANKEANDERVLAERDLALIGRRTVRQYVALLHALAQLHIAHFVLTALQTLHKRLHFLFAVNCLPAVLIAVIMGGQLLSGAMYVELCIQRPVFFRYKGCDFFLAVRNDP